MRTIKSYSFRCKDLFINRTSRVDPSVSCVDLKTETYAVKVNLWFFLDFHLEDFMTFIWQISWLPVRKRWATSTFFKSSPPLWKASVEPIQPKQQCYLATIILHQLNVTPFYTLQVPSSSIQACYFHNENNPTSEPCVYLHKWSQFPAANLFAYKCQRFVTEYAFFKREGFHGKPIWQMMDLCSEYSTITNRLLRAFESTVGSAAQPCYSTQHNLIYCRLISIKRNTSHTPNNYWGLIWG